MAISKILTLRGYQVFTSGTAKGIIETVVEHKPDVILMDHYMPDGLGKDAIKQLKSSEITQSIPVIYFSTYASLGALAKEAGADGYVSKTSSVEFLTDSIDSFLNRTKGAGEDA